VALEENGGKYNHRLKVPAKDVAEWREGVESKRKIMSSGVTAEKPVGKKTAWEAVKNARRRRTSRRNVRVV